MTTAAATRWAMKGTGYEYCNCDFGCGCNFGGFPNSKDGSCRALVGFSIDGGSCGDVDLSGVKAAAVIAWPKAIHEGNGQAAFIVDPATTDQQVDVLAQIFTGKLGGLPALGAAGSDVRGRGARKGRDHDRRQWTHDHVSRRGYRRRPRRRVQEPGHGRRSLRRGAPPERIHLDQGRMWVGVPSRLRRRPGDRLGQDELDPVSVRLVERVLTGRPGG